MFSHDPRIGWPQDSLQGRSAMGVLGQRMEQCMAQCCKPQYDPTFWMQGPSNYHETDYCPASVSGRLEQMRQFGASERHFQPSTSHPWDGQALSPYGPHMRAPSYNQYHSFSKYPGGDSSEDLWSDKNMGDGWSGMPWSQYNQADPSCDTWMTSTMTGDTPFSSSGGHLNSGWTNQSLLGNNSRRPGSTCPNPQLHTGCTEDCSLKQENTQSLFSRIMNKFRPPPPKCPLKPQTANPSKFSGKSGYSNSCFERVGKPKQLGDAFDSLDDLWNPRKIRRWGCVSNWDQHKESQWKQVIENKLGGCGSASRSVESKVREAIEALHQEGADCIAFRMFYGILKRNEDVYLNPYMNLMSDEEFLRLVVALNNFYFEDKDKAKLFLDHPPPSWIEQIMQKETLTILDPNSKAPTIVRRFWELLLDWYAQKLVAKADPIAHYGASNTSSQSSLGSL